MLSKIRNQRTSSESSNSIAKQAAIDVKRRCKKCLELKPLLTDFYLNSSKTDYVNICKKCKKDGVIASRKVRLPGTNTEIEKSDLPESAPTVENHDPGTLNLDKPMENPEMKHYRDYNVELPDLPVFSWSTYESMKHYSTVFLSARNTGKTTLLKDYYKYVVRNNYDLSVLFCNSLNAPIYEFLTEEEKRTTFPEFDRRPIQFLEEIQTRTKNHFHLHFGWDDCIDFQRQKNSDELVQLYTRGRNMNASLCFSTQAVTSVAKPARGNIDFLFFGRVNVNEAWEQVVETLFRGLIGFGMPIKIECQFWYDLIHSKFEPYTFLVIDFLHGGKLYKYKSENK